MSCGTIIVAEFAIRRKGALHVGIGNRRSRAVRKREPNSAIEGQRLGLAACCHSQEDGKKGEQICEAQPPRQSEFHLVTLPSRHPDPTVHASDKYASGRKFAATNKL